MTADQQQPTHALAPGPPLLLDAGDVRRLLPMIDCIDAMDRAMRATSAGAVTLPMRQFSDLADGSGTLGVMPGSAKDPNVYGAKVVGRHPANPQHGRPAIQGLMILFDQDTGAPVAVMDGAELTALRTAAASGLATRALAREDAKSLGILGYGVQAASHLDAVCAVRNIDEVLVWGRSRAKADAFAARHAERLGLAVRACDPETVSSCDVVCTTTGAEEPILFGRWLKPGSHLNLVGTHTPNAREVDSAAIARSAVYVDLRSSAKEEAGDILMAIDEGAITADHVLGEIGEVLAGVVPGRRDRTQITLYKSVGVVSQDLFAADVVYRSALAAQQRRKTDEE